MSGQLSREDRLKVLEICQKWDIDGDGAISRAELGQALREIFPTCSERDVEDLLRTVDINDDGVIQYIEFLSWMELPAQDKLSFGDHLKSVILEGSTARRRKASFVAPLQQDTGAGRTPSASSSGGLPEEIRHLLKLFTHNLLDRFKVVSREDMPTSQIVSVLPHEDRSIASETKLECSGGNIFYIRVAPSIILERAAEPPGRDQILEELDGLADVYEEIFSRLCDAISQSGGAGIRKLQLRPITCLSLSLSLLPVNADKTWAAIALALARLPLQVQKALQVIQVEVVDDSASKTALAETLASKTAVALQPLLLEKDGRLPQMRGKFDWIRRDNSPSCRLYRLMTFMQTQRATTDSYASHRHAPVVKLKGVKDMMRGTKIKMVDPGATAPSSRGGRETRVLLPAQAVGLADTTVMEVAQLLEKKGRKVAAVSAASAYKRGGGASTGGRHALEEAWCIMSTLFASLQTLESQPTWHVEACGSHADASRVIDFMTHIPTLGCVVSPAVEIFREPTSQGYGFLDKPVMLSAVISVAMFNRNPGVADSPLDSPDDPCTYIAETQQKFEAVVAAAIELKIQDLVIPDAGCGVFQNDALVVGGCLGAVLRKYKGHLENVIVVGTTPAFFEGCQRVFEGSDPRSICPDGASCKRLGDKMHKARCLHAGISSGKDSLDDALKELVENPEITAKPACRYGVSCRIKDPRHLECFSHPEVNLEREDSAPSCPECSSESPQQSQLESTDTRPLCRFGEKCYDRKPDHLAKFAHPWLVGGESPEEARARKDIQDSHTILDFAKHGKWIDAKVELRKRPHLINLRPEPRRFNLLHAATFQMNTEIMEWLIDIMLADPTMKSKDGESVVDIYREAMREKPPKSESDRKNDELLVGWLSKLQTEKISLRDYHRRHVSSLSPKEPAVPQEERIQGAKMIVKHCFNSALNGDYAELRHCHGGYPVYRNKGAGVNYYMFHYASSSHGYRDSNNWWVINTELVDGPGLAYLLTKLPLRDPSQKPYGEYWNVLYKSAITSSFQLDTVMRVESRDACMNF